MDSNITINIGDNVMSVYGRIGKVIEICNCDACRKRGFREPIVQWDEDKDKHYITEWQFKNGFPDWYKIGNIIFSDHVNINELREIIKDDEEEIEFLQSDIKDMLALIDEITKQGENPDETLVRQWHEQKMHWQF